MPCYRGHLFEQPREPRPLCARPAVLGTQDFIPASHWSRSPIEGIVYPFTGDQYLPDPDAGPPQPPPEPIMMRRPKRARLIKPGKLRPMGGKYSLGGLRGQPLYVQGRRPGWKPPDPTLEEQSGRTGKLTLKTKLIEQADSSGDRDSDFDSDSERGSTEQRKGLHASKVGLNISVHDLGADFKRQRILERLKLLEVERGKQTEEEEHAHDRIIKFETSEGSIQRGSESSGTSLRSCSTCKNSLDALMCSKPQNQRKSLAKWREKDREAFEKAITQLTPEESDGNSTQSLKLLSNINVSYRPWSGDNVYDDDDSDDYDDSDDEFYREIHRSQQSLDLSIKDFGSEFSRKQFVERLKMLESEPRISSQTESIDEQISEDIRNILILAPEENTKMPRHCSTCRSSPVVQRGTGSVETFPKQIGSTTDERPRKTRSRNRTLVKQTDSQLTIQEKVSD